MGKNSHLHAEGAHRAVTGVPGNTQPIGQLRIIGVYPCDYSLLNTQILPFLYSLGLNLILNTHILPVSRVK